MARRGCYGERSWPSGCPRRLAVARATRAEIDDLLRLLRDPEVGGGRMAAGRMLSSDERDDLWARWTMMRSAAPEITGD